jgi:hypothetical protein
MWKGERNQAKQINEDSCDMFVSDIEYCDMHAVGQQWKR